MGINSDKFLHRYLDDWLSFVPTGLDQESHCVDFMTGDSDSQCYCHQILGLTQLRRFESSPVVTVRKTISNCLRLPICNKDNFAEGFDLVVCWGVLHHTHDPYKGCSVYENHLGFGGQAKNMAKYQHHKL